MRQVEEAGLRVGTRERRTADRNEVVSNLFFAHHRRLVGLAALLVTDQQIAEDVVQEAFAGLYRRWRQLRDPNAAVGYLNRAVVNGSLASLRRKRRAGVAMLRLAPRHEERESAEHDALDHQQADRLWAAVIALPMRQRQVLVLRYYLDQSEAEIADTLEISRGSVKPLVFSRDPRSSGAMTTAGLAMHRDRDALMLGAHPALEFREVRLHLG